MNARLAAYLAQAYRRDILGESVAVEMPGGPELIADIRTELARIDALNLGPHLANRDYASYQHQKALKALLARLETRDAADGEGPKDTLQHAEGVRPQEG